MPTRITLLLCACSLAMAADAVMGTPRCAAQSAVVVPLALKTLQSFRGRVTYRAYPLSAITAPPGLSAEDAVVGTLIVSGPRWTLDERSAHTSLHASPDSSWIHLGSQTFAFDDPFALDALANAWAPALADIAAGTVAVAPDGKAWNASEGIRIFLGPDSLEVSGIVDTRTTDIAYSFDDWETVNGLRLPHRILRLRSGASERSFQIADYTVEWAALTSSAIPPSSGQTQSADDSAAATSTNASSSLPVRWFGTIFGLLFLSIAFVAWLRRDTLTDHLCRSLASDPRAWRDEGHTVFVTPDGVLLFQGRSYHVGPRFYNRVTTVQSSPLFLRVSAPNVPHVVLARKFGSARVSGGGRSTSPTSARAARAGFSLIESLVATSLFALVVVGVAFPTMIVLGQADRLAAQRQAALRLAANALVDEQAALAYGTISDTSRSSRVNGMTVMVTLQPAAISGAHTVDIQVNDAREQPLAHIATLVGPPVPAPGMPTPSPR